MAFRIFLLFVWRVIVLERPIGITILINCFNYVIAQKKNCCCCCGLFAVHSSPCIKSQSRQTLKWNLYSRMEQIENYCKKIWCKLINRNICLEMFLFYEFALICCCCSFCLHLPGDKFHCIMQYLNRNQPEWLSIFGDVAWF